MRVNAVLAVAGAFAVAFLAAAAPASAASVRYSCLVDGVTSTLTPLPPLGLGFGTEGTYSLELGDFGSVNGLAPTCSVTGSGAPAVVAVNLDSEGTWSGKCAQFSMVGHSAIGEAEFDYLIVVDAGIGQLYTLAGPVFGQGVLSVSSRDPLDCVAEPTTKLHLTGAITLTYSY